MPESGNYGSKMDPSFCCHLATYLPVLRHLCSSTPFAEVARDGLFLTEAGRRSRAANDVDLLLQWRRIKKMRDMTMASKVSLASELRRVLAAAEALHAKREELVHPRHWRLFEVSMQTVKKTQER